MAMRQARIRVSGENFYRPCERQVIRNGQEGSRHT